MCISVISESCSQVFALLQREVCIAISSLALCAICLKNYYYYLFFKKFLIVDHVRRQVKHKCALVTTLS